MRADSETIEVTAGPMVAGGDALYRQPGEKVLFIRGALPGEQVSVNITENRKDLRRGTVSAVNSPSPNRIEPPCPMFKKGCGGCQWQFANTEAQHQFKVDIVRDALARIAKLPDAPVTFGGSVSPFGYRTTMRLQVVDGKVALHQRGSHDLVTLDTCLIAHPALNELIVDGNFGEAKEVTLRVSVATGERIAYVHSEDGEEVELDLPSDVIVTHNGKIAFSESVLGRKFQVSARSFFQSGQEAAELVARTVNSVVPEDTDWVVDAYAGVGILGATVAQGRDCRVTAIEQSHSAARDASINLADIAGEVVETEVAEVELTGMDRPDVVIADPSRTGLGPSASKALATLRPYTFVLVSCDPASLARDHNLLSDHGFKLQNVQVLDLFPQTHHVETVSVFSR